MAQRPPPPAGRAPGAARRGGAGQGHARPGVAAGRRPCARCDARCVTGAASSKAAAGAAPPRPHEASRGADQAAQGFAAARPRLGGEHGVDVVQEAGVLRHLAAGRLGHRVVVAHRLRGRRLWGVGGHHLGGAQLGRRRRKPSPAYPTSRSSALQRQRLAPPPTACEPRLTKGRIGSDRTISSAAVGPPTHGARGTPGPAPPTTRPPEFLRVAARGPPRPCSWRAGSCRGAPRPCAGGQSRS
jgi:hypothetical protein